MASLLSSLIVLAIFITPLVLWIIALVDIIKSDFYGNNKLIWLLLVILVPLLGAILYFFVGKKQKMSASDIRQGMSANKFCSECGEELNPRAEMCPKRGVRQMVPRNPGSSPVLIVVLVVVVGLGAIAGIGILSAIAIPQFSAYRMKAFDAAALADIKNAKTCAESYAADHNGSYPTELGNTFHASTDVTTEYQPSADNGYLITTFHKRGSKIYLASSSDPKISVKNKNDSAGQFHPL